MNHIWSIELWEYYESVYHANCKKLCKKRTILFGQVTDNYHTDTVFNSCLNTDIPKKKKKKETKRKEKKKKDRKKRYFISALRDAKNPYT